MLTPRKFHVGQMLPNPLLVMGIMQRLLCWLGKLEKYMEFLFCNLIPIELKQSKVVSSNKISDVFVQIIMTFALCIAIWGHLLDYKARTWKLSNGEWSGAFFKESSTQRALRTGDLVCIYKLFSNLNKNLSTILNTCNKLSMIYLQIFL